ncbi:MAG: hypothetical protein PHP08_03830 [Candidatus Dojkabacteria bacterium]|nr:hypothetical protein [Candidatus Dojkabacteria bacterium]
MKILVALDTNQINTNNYKTGRPGGNFETVINYIRDNKLVNQINILVPETVTRELFMHIKNSYNDDLTKLTNIKKSMDRTPNHEIKLTLPNAEDYYKYIKKQINSEILKYNFIKIPKLPESKKIDVLNSLIENCDEDQTRFHDQLIIEEVKHYKYFNNYDRVFLFSNNGKDIRSYLPSNIELYTSWEEMKQTLDAIFIIGDTEEETKFKRFLEENYSKELIREACRNSIGIDLKLNKVEYDHMVPEVAGEEAFFVVKFEGVGKEIKYKIKGEVFFNTTNTIDNIEIIYQ